MTHWYILSFHLQVGSLSNMSALFPSQMWLKKTDISTLQFDVNKQAMLIPKDEPKITNFQWIPRSSRLFRSRSIYSYIHIDTMKSRWNSKYLTNLNMVKTATAASSLSSKNKTIFSCRLFQHPEVSPPFTQKPNKYTPWNKQQKPLKINGWKVRLPFGMPIFGGELLVLGRALPTKMAEEMWIFFHILIEFSPDWPI